MSVETLKSTFTPLGGVNYEDNSARLPTTQVQAAVNRLFEEMKCKSRPGLNNTTITGVTGPISFVENVVCNSVQYSIYINQAGLLFYVASGIGTGPINGPGTTFGNVAFQNITSIIGKIVFGNNTGGIITWDPTVLANNYAVVASAPYRYIIGQQGRAIAAYDTSASLLTGPRTFAWSKPGDLTIWTSTDGSAGNESLAEISGEITGLGVLHNIGVIPWRGGIHLAYPTGTLPLPYNVQSFILKGCGIWFPATVAFTDEHMFGVGEDDVYLFDLQTFQPIGKAIRKELLTNLYSGVLYRGVVTRYSASFYPRYRYHLFPINSAASAHFVYDLSEQTWGRHTYTQSANWAWNMPSPASSGLGDFGIAFVDNSNPPVAHYWDTSLSCEATGNIVRYVGNLDTLDTDYQIEDIILHWQDFGSITVTITIVGQGSQGPVNTTATLTITGTNDGAWKRAFLSRSTSSIRQLGNDFVITLSFAAAQTSVIDQVTILATPQGDYRG